MGPELTALLDEMIPRKAAQKHTAVVSREDLEQEMWLAAFTHEQALEAHRQNGNDAALWAVLNRAVNSALQAEERQERVKKAMKAGYETRDEIFYSIGLLKRLLPVYLDMGVTEHPLVGREIMVGSPGVSKEESGDYLATIVDVDRGFKALSQGKQKLLRRYFSYPQGSGGMTHVEIAFEMGEPPTALGTRVHHALRALQRELGGQNPWNRGPTPKRGK